MFQRTLILAAISAAFAPGITASITPCHSFSYEVQRVLSPDNPHTFPIVKNFNYIRDSISYTFHLPNLIFRGAFDVHCQSVFDKDFKYHGAIMNFKGPHLGIHTNDALIYNNQPGFFHPLKTSFTSQLFNYTLEFRFEIDSYTSHPLNICLTRDSLQTTFSADGIMTDVGISLDVSNELDDHPDAVVEAINNYLPLFASNLTTILNERLCQDQGIPAPTTVIPTTTHEGSQPLTIRLSPSSSTSPARPTKPRSTSSPQHGFSTPTTRRPPSSSTSPARPTKPRSTSSPQHRFSTPTTRRPPSSSTSPARPTKPKSTSSQPT
ncbi:uncharacterized protein [Palaemon carinicauda]|uniref:uncharacterized protein n=1 Tax=Palaemon carinicauda TaxID=392227 RepID=UPI0035B59656